MSGISKEMKARETQIDANKDNEKDEALITIVPADDKAD